MLNVHVHVSGTKKISYERQIWPTSNKEFVTEVTLRQNEIVVNSEQGRVAVASIKLPSRSCV